MLNIPHLKRAFWLFYSLKLYLYLLSDLCLFWAVKQCSKISLKSDLVTHMSRVSINLSLRAFYYRIALGKVDGNDKTTNNVLNLTFAWSGNKRFNAFNREWKPFPDNFWFRQYVSHMADQLSLFCKKKSLFPIRGLSTDIRIIHSLRHTWTRLTAHCLWATDIERGSWPAHEVL